MKLPNPLSLKIQQEHTTVVSSYIQVDGVHADRKSMCISHIPDEFFAIARASDIHSYSDVAPVLTAETAVWAYKHIRVKPTYRKDKGLFINHIFRSANLSLWQKQKDPQYTHRLSTGLLVAIIGSWRVWVGSVGDTSAWIVHDQTLTRLTADDVDDFGTMTKTLGSSRYGLTPQFYVAPFMTNDMLFLATASVVNYINVRELEALFHMTIDNREHMQDVLQKIVTTSVTNGNTDNKIACLIKRIALTN